MIFSERLPLQVIFKSWNIENNRDLALSCIGIFLFGCLHEYLKILQIRFSKNGFGSTVVRFEEQDLDVDNNKAKDKCKPEAKSTVRSRDPRMYSKMLTHCVNTFAHCTLLTWTYAMMLTAMTMNPAILCSAIGGCSVGYFLFHRPRPKSRPQDVAKDLKVGKDSQPPTSEHGIAEEKV